MTDFDKSPKGVKEFHTKDDVDSSTKAHHHTLGDGLMQAARGSTTKQRFDEAAAANDLRFDALEAYDLLVEGRLDALEAVDVLLDGRLDALEAVDVLLDGRLDALEAPLEATEANAGGNQTGGATVGSWVSGANLPGEVFTAPRSGAVLITVSGYIRSLTAGQGMLLDCEVREGNVIGSGTVVRSPTANTSAGNYNVQFIRTSALVFLEGLTPGAEYNAKGFYFQTAGTGHLINNSYMQVAKR